MEALSNKGFKHAPLRYLLEKQKKDPCSNTDSCFSLPHLFFPRNRGASLGIFVVG